MTRAIQAGIAAGISLLLSSATATHGSERVSLYAPADGGVVLGREVIVDARGECARSNADLHARLDEHSVSLSWTPGAYKGQWIARLPLARDGYHELALVGRCRALTRFHSRTTGASAVGWSVARNFIHRNNVSQLSWDWGPAIFFYGLSKLDPRAPWIRDYQSYWAGKGVSMPDHADACPSGLGALELLRAQDDFTALDSAQAVARYISTEPRNTLGAINHMGHWFWKFVFPKSIWVDSLEMVAVFAAQWGNFSHDSAMLDFAAAQPGIYASVLQDADTGLFHHAYNLERNITMPRDATFWLRGNGWAVASIVDILDELPADHPKRGELEALLKRIVDGLLRYQQKTGYWDSLANLPGATYGESSGTALIAYAIAKAVHRGWLDPSKLSAAKAAFAAVTARLQPIGHAAAPDDKDLPLQLSMPRISGATNPGPRWLYKLVPAVADAPYGVGAYLMAAAELRDETF